MSRSYRHNPLVKSGCKNKFKRLLKQQTNRKIRRKLNRHNYDEIGNGKHYKKHFDLLEHFVIRRSTLSDAQNYYNELTSVNKYETLCEYQKGENTMVNYFLKIYPNQKDYINRWWKINYLRK